MRYAKGLTSFGIDRRILPRSHGPNFFSSQPSKGLLKIAQSNKSDQYLEPNNLRKT